MKTYVVLYRDKSLEPDEAPFALIYEAENADHAKKRLKTAYPSADVVWVHEGSYIDDAYNEYWDV